MWLGKIPGHSGTQLKRRLGFASSELIKDEMMHAGLPITHTLDIKRDNHVAIILIDSLKVVSFVTLFFALGFLCYQFTPQTFFSPLLSASEQLIIEDEIKYSFFQHTLKNGTIALKNLDIANAHTLFIEALEICPSEIESRIGLFETTSILCKERNLYCSQADSYMVYLQRETEIPFKEIMRIRNVTYVP